MRYCVPNPAPADPCAAEKWPIHFVVLGPCPVTVTLPLRHCSTVYPSSVPTASPVGAFHRYSSF